MGQAREQSGNKNPKVGTKWEQEPQSKQSGNKVGHEPQSGTRMGIKWEQNGIKNPQSEIRIGTKWGTKWKQEPQSGTRTGTNEEKSGNKNPKVATKWEQSDSNPKVGTKWEPQSGTRTGIKWK